MSTANAMSRRMLRIIALSSFLLAPAVPSQQPAPQKPVREAIAPRVIQTYPCNQSSGEKKAPHSGPPGRASAGDCVVRRSSDAVSIHQPCGDANKQSDGQCGIRP